MFVAELVAGKPPPQPLPNIPKHLHGISYYRPTQLNVSCLRNTISTSSLENFLNLCNFIILISPQELWVIASCMGECVSTWSIFQFDIFLPSNIFRRFRNTFWVLILPEPWQCTCSKSNGIREKKFGASSERLTLLNFQSHLQSLILAFFWWCDTTPDWAVPYTIMCGDPWLWLMEVLLKCVMSLDSTLIYSF